MGNSFAGCGLFIDGLVFLSAKEALPFLEKDAILVDLREDYEKSGREFQVRNVIALPYGNLSDDFEELPRDQSLILADSVGLRSKAAARFLKERGYESIASLNGGMVDWAKEGMPTSIDREQELIGSCSCKIAPRKYHRTRKP